MGHARAIINVENPADQLFIFNKILKEDLSVRKVEELVRQLHQSKTKKETTKATSPAGNTAKELAQLQSRLSSHFGTRVAVKSDGKRGEIKIPFMSIEDLNRILDILRLP
jgi:ParB family chromosome partitioning protein